MTSRSFDARRHRLALAGLLLFAGATWLLVLSGARKFVGDESFYIEAAERMRSSGDWLTPRFENGDLRFQKPVLHYWLVALSRALFGDGLFGARLPSALAALFAVLLTDRIAWVLTGRRAVALGAAAMLSGTPMLYSLATRATPDATLVAATALAVLGVARALRRGGADRGAAWLFWVGIGLGVATKGLVVLLLVATTAALALSPRRRRPLVEGLARPAPALTAVLLGGAWFATMFALHGGDALRAFLDDQVAEKTGIDAPTFAANLASYSFAPVRHFLPWLLPLLVLLRWRGRRIAAAARRNRAAILLGLAFFGVALLAFSLGAVKRSRYLAPTFCGLAVALAPLFAAATAGAASPVPWRRLRTALLALALLLVLALFRIDVVGGSIGAGLLLSGLLLRRATIALAAPPSARWALGLAALSLAIWSGMDAAVVARLRPDPWPEVVREVVARTRPGDAVETEGLDNSEFARLRVLLPRDRRILRAPRTGDPEPETWRLRVAAEPSAPEEGAPHWPLPEPSVSDLLDRLLGREEKRSEKKEARSVVLRIPSEAPR